MTLKRLCGIYLLCIGMMLTLVKCTTAASSLSQAPTTEVQTPSEPVIIKSKPALNRTKKQQLLNDLDEMNSRVEIMRQKLNKLSK